MLRDSVSNRGNLTLHRLLLRQDQRRGRVPRGQRRQKEAKRVPAYNLVSRQLTHAVSVLRPFVHYAQTVSSYAKEKNAATTAQLR